jgi:hypothetical protein
MICHYTTVMWQSYIAPMCFGYFKVSIIRIYTTFKKWKLFLSGTHHDNGYFGVAETYNCSVQLLHSSCALTSHILLLCVLETQH